MEEQVMGDEEFEDGYAAGWSELKEQVLSLFSPELLDRDPSLQKIMKAVEEMKCPL
jgi:hypothetical protein